MTKGVGYYHPDYAGSFAEFGRPRELPHCGGWVLERAIPGHSQRDAMGCYPLFACRDWSRLKNDLEELTDLVCVSLVTDPFGAWTVEQLHECFPDRVLPFKEHYVLDLRGGVRRFIRGRTLTYARAALRTLRVEVCDTPADFLEDWLCLYQYLIERHQLSGIHAFSRRSFARQMTVPGFVMFRARLQRMVVGMLSWYVQGEVGYAHLLGMSPAGYELRAAYALYWSAIQHFAGRLRWLDLGGVPGITGEEQEGLARFKRGWSSGTRPAYFCGRILDRDRYERIVRAAGPPPDGYFPAYRAGEFGNGCRDESSP
jgi:hypothetical protein